MTLTQHIPKTAARRGALLFGCMCSVSCITLLGDGFDHLHLFLPLALLNFAVGALASERVTRAFLVLEVSVIFGFLDYTVFQIHERFPAT